MRFLFALMLAAIATPERAQSEAAEPVEVMVLGTYHFDNPGLDLNNPRADDVLQPHRQRELEALAAALAEFRPTKIMAERVAEDLIDPKYPAFAPAALAQQRDERVQIAYRLAHALGHEVVYAIDEQPGPGEPDYFPFGKMAEWAEANGAKDRLEAMLALAKAKSAEIERSQEGTIPAALAALNGAVVTENDQSIYYETLAIGDVEQQPGADLNAMWYLRNAKIFTKLQQAAEPGDRVLVVYGAGHNYWLRHFAATTRGYRSVDPVPYLQEADAALR